MFFFFQKKERVFHRWRISTVKGRETTGQLYTLVSKMITTSHERVYLMFEIGDTDFFIFFFFAKPKISGRLGSGQNSMEVVRESLDAVYNAVSIVLGGQSLLFRLRCLSFRDTKHATSSCTCVYGHCVKGKGVKKKRTGQEKNMEDKGVLCSP